MGALISLFAGRKGTDVFYRELTHIDANKQKELKWQRRLKDTHSTMRRRLLLYGSLASVCFGLYVFFVPREDQAEKALWTGLALGLPVLLFLMLQIINAAFKSLLGQTDQKLKQLEAQEKELEQAIRNDPAELRKIEALSKVLSPAPVRTAPPAAMVPGTPGARPQGMRPPQQQQQQQQQMMTPQQRQQQQAPGQQQGQQQMPQTPMQQQQQQHMMQMAAAAGAAAEARSPPRTIFDKLLEAVVGEPEAPQLIQQVNRLQDENARLKAQLAQAQSALARMEAGPAHDPEPQAAAPAATTTAQPSALATTQS